MDSKTCLRSVRTQQPNRSEQNFYSKTNVISVNDGLGQGPPMASSRGAGNRNFNVENACSSFLGQGLAMASSPGPGNIYLEHVGVNGLGQGPPRGVTFTSCNINLRNSSGNANGVGPGTTVYTTTRPGGAAIHGGY